MSSKSDDGKAQGGSGAQPGSENAGFADQAKPGSLGEENQYNLAIKKLASEDDLQEFHSLSGALARSAESLTKDQKKALRSLRGGPRARQEFEVAHPRMKDVQENFSPDDHQLFILNNAAVDDKPFDKTDRPLDTHHPTLTPEQNEMLSAAKQSGRDLKSFEEVDQYLAQKGLALSPEQIWELGTVALARNQQVQRSEFDQADGLLHVEELYRMAVPADKVEDKTPAEELSAIQAPQLEVLESDKLPLTTLPPPPYVEKRKPREGIIGRVTVYVNRKYARLFPRRKEPVPSQLPVTEALGVAALGFLVIGIYVVPPSIQNQANGPNSEKHARQKLSKAIHEDLRKDSQQEAQQIGPGQAPNSGGGPSASGGSGGGGDASSPVRSAEQEKRDKQKEEALKGPVPEELRFARTLSSKGNSQAAIPYFESYVKLCPHSIEARMDLIDAYLKTKDKEKARKLCITTFKQHLSSDQVSDLWGRWRQCLID